MAAQERFLSAHGVTARSSFVQLKWKGLRTHFLEQNGAGEPLVFIHGGGCFAAIWAPLMSRLREHSVFAVDRPGFGLTDPMKHRPKTIRTEAVAFLEGVLDALDLERATLVANSLGSLWSFFLAIDRPSRVKRMIHIGWPALILGTSPPLPLRLLGVPLVGKPLTAMLSPSPANVRKVLAEMNEDSALDKDPVLGDIWMAAERLPDFTPSWRGALRSIVTVFGPRKAVSLTEEVLKQVRHPVQFIWGARDPLSPVQTGRRAVGIMPDARLEVVPGGHLPWLDAPDQTARIVRDFLKESEGPDAEGKNSSRR
jgi:pimeloyl-ACP methyl ester carboxylesterase